jgi:hypothetical protein
VTGLCDLATNLPILVGSLLDREANLKKGRFREETLTDIVTGALAAFAGPELVIEYPDEAVTGGDLDLEFWHVETGKSLSLRIQAKRLSAESENGKAVKIKNRAYKELLHKVPTTGAYQFHTLKDSSDKHLPLYMFYNHGSVTRDSEFLGKHPAVKGINLAFASDIARQMEDELSAKPKRRNHKRLSHLRPYFFDLSEILCPPTSVGGSVPTPDAVFEALREAWDRVLADSGPDGDVERVIRLLLGDRWFSIVRSSRRRIADGAAIRINREIKLPVITFISGRTEDDRTPRIFEDGPTPE